MTLSKYRAKRDLKSSGEPFAKIKKTKESKQAFVIQQHHASHLHYDLRLEVGGVLKSWAIPKIPSLDPRIKRLAIMVEDHPYEYKDFEGVIPFGYGAGTVSIWDQGTYTVGEIGSSPSEKTIKKGLKEGKLEISLEGKKLKGTFFLIRLKTEKKNEWLFFKKKEEDGSKNAKEKVGLTNLNKIYWKKDKITKGDLLAYYKKIAPYILPYLKDRPESLHRFPNGIHNPSFFQKNLDRHPDWIKTAHIQSADKKVEYLLIQDEESLLYAVNLGCIEFHPFFSKVSSIQKPDFLVFDLDPKDASFEKVILIAKAIHTLLEEIDVSSYCKTSGATGLHVAVPLGKKYTYNEAKKFAELIAVRIRDEMPEIATLERSIAKRKGKVYIDYLQNNFGKTLVSVYSVRARDGASVSTPLKWSEVKKGLNPSKFTLNTLLPRLKKMGDLFAPVLKKGVNLKAALKKLSI